MLHFGQFLIIRTVEYRLLLQRTFPLGRLHFLELGRADVGEDPPLVPVFGLFDGDSSFRLKGCLRKAEFFKLVAISVGAQVSQLLFIFLIL